MDKRLCLAKCVVSKLTCCLGVSGVGVVGFVDVSCVGGGLFFCIVNGVDCFPDSFAVCVVQVFNEEFW